MSEDTISLFFSNESPLNPFSFFSVPSCQGAYDRDPSDGLFCGTQTAADLRSEPRTFFF